MSIENEDGFKKKLGMCEDILQLEHLLENKILKVPNLGLVKPPKCDIIFRPEIVKIRYDFEETLVDDIKSYPSKSNFVISGTDPQEVVRNLFTQAVLELVYRSRILTLIDSYNNACFDILTSPIISELILGGNKNLHLAGLPSDCSRVPCRIETMPFTVFDNKLYVTLRRCHTSNNNGAVTNAWLQHSKHDWYPILAVIELINLESIFVNNKPKEAQDE